MVLIGNWKEKDRCKDQDSKRNVKNIADKPDKSAAIETCLTRPEQVVAGAAATDPLE